MGREVNRRKYESPVRRHRAAATRSAVLQAARRLFTEQGYAHTSVHDIATEAGVSVDTLYTSVGRKPQLLLAVHDMLLAEDDAPLAAEQRRYVQAIRAASTARAKITTYADALARLMPKVVPLQEALRDAGATDPACRDAYTSLSQRRAQNMSRFVEDLRQTGDMRDDIDDTRATTLIWSMNSAEYFTLLRDQGLAPSAYGAFVRDVWIHALLGCPQDDDQEV